MTAFVSAANGNASSASTWTPVGPKITPTTGDTVTVNHAVTWDAGMANVILGTSPGSAIQGSTSAFPSGTVQTVPAVTINGSGGNDGGWSAGTIANNPTFAQGNGVLSVVTGQMFQVRGDIVGNTGSLVLSAGVLLIFDVSQSPASTTYVLELLGTYNRFGGFLASNGTPANRCTISGSAMGAGRIGCGWRTTGTEGYSGDAGVVRATCTDFTNMGMPASTLGVTLGTSGNINITGGTPTIALSNGATASFTGTSGTGYTAAPFSYSTARTHTSTSTLRMAPAGINLNGAVIKDSNGNVTPILMSYTLAQATSNLVTLTTTWQAPVTVANIAGTPGAGIVLTNGMDCLYASGSGTTTLVFQYQASAQVSLSGVCVNNVADYASRGNLLDASGNVILQQSTAVGFYTPVVTNSPDAWPFWSMRLSENGGTNPNAAAYLRYCTVNASTCITGAPVGMQWAGYSFDLTGTSFLGGIDNICRNSQVGYGVTDAGSDVYVSSYNAATAGDLRQIVACHFDRTVVVYATQNFTLQGNNFANGWVNNATSPGTTTTWTGNLQRVPAGYTAGGEFFTVGFSSTVNGDLFVSDSPVLANSHFLTSSAGAGVATIENMVFDVQNTGGGYNNLQIGGNVTISYNAASGSAWSASNSSGNLLVIKGNVACVDHNSLNTSTGPMAGQFIGPGVFTQDEGQNVNFAYSIAHCTHPMPAGLGVSDPNEQGDMPVGGFLSFANNVVWQPTWSSLSGHAMWFRQSSSVVTDSILAANVSNNCVYNVGATDQSYVGVTAASVAGTTGTPNAVTGGTAVTTPGYFNAHFSASGPAPGANDVHSDPAFVDPSRSTVAYDLAQGGPGTVANLVAQLRSCAVANSNNGGQGGPFYAQTLTLPTAIQAVYTWIRAGFATQNPALKGAATDGTDIGAVASVYVAPALTAPTAASSAEIGIGSKLVIRIGATKAVTVTGTPVLTLNDGGTATYSSSESTGTMLAFDYVVASPQTEAAGALAVTAFSLNGGSIFDAVYPGVAASAANGSAVVATIASAPQVQGVAPFPVSVTASPSSGTLGNGAALTVSVVWSEAVTVTGAPQIALSSGAMAYYSSSASSSTTSVFTSVVGAGQTASPLAIAASIALNGGTIADAAGNPATLALPALSSAPSIDGVAPVVTSVAFIPASGTLPAGATYAVTLGLSKPVTISVGSPSLVMSDGSMATYVAASSSPTSLVFQGDVKAGAAAGKLTVSSASANGATILDEASNPLVLSGATATPANGAPSVDGVAPVASAATLSPASGYAKAGSILSLTVPFSKPVTTGGATATLSDNLVLKAAATTTASPSLVFTGTVASGEDATSLAISSISGPIHDAAGNSAVVTEAVASVTGPTIITVSPTATAITTTAASGATLALGSTSHVNLQASGALLVGSGSAMPALTMSDGTTAAYSPSLSAPATGLLVFLYTVSSSSTAGELSVTGYTGTVTDLAGNALASLPTTDLGVSVNPTPVSAPSGGNSVALVKPSSLPAASSLGVADGLLVVVGGKVSVMSLASLKVLLG